MSDSQYETYAAYGPRSAPPGTPGESGTPGGAGPGVHNAETVPYGAVYGAPHGGTYRTAYEAVAQKASVPAPGYTGVSEPVLPRQSGSTPGEAARQPGAAPQPGARGGVGRRATRRRRPRSAERPESAVRRLLPQALVVAFLACGTTAFVAKDKVIELDVDGRQRTLHTFADDVSELLAEEGVPAGAHDVVAPAPDAALASGDAVAVRYGRPVRLTLDGRRHEVWTTASTVEGALDELGVRAEGAYLSTSRSRSIGRAGLALDVRTERAVTIMADGRARTIRTNAATVREAVEEAGIALRGQDTTSAPPGSFPRDGQTVTVLRVRGTREVREEQIPFEVERTEDPSLFRGTEVVTDPGRPGLRRTTYLLRTVNGVRQKPRREKSEVVRRPRKRVVLVGTKPLPRSVHGADHLNWGGLAACESGGRPHAVDPSGTYGGLYQFDTHTWHSLGGSGRPQDAAAEEQTYRAKKLYVRRGASPWPHCGARLHG
ncbi:resuscitation-promoting factor [Streptomyces pluripotens]|uniref:Resuscitation-promoting factor n=1 Tax=Streptomyces pluripotens TaxID=1355015 RepID=A0A221P1L3_9ACTN|nr:resuscitation-promoting factor [Streptomyces pluripotens]ARP71791.1 resuscitation-promoting factor [Streptomyces pluripotens]ASN26042.1 resuscitation-promoting factor [Streptomyces pluripotens]